MNLDLTDPLPIDSDLQIIFCRRCSQFLCSPITGRRDEWMEKDIAEWETMFADVPRFSDLNKEQCAKIKTFVTAGIRFAYLTFSNIEIVIDNDFDTLSMSLSAASFVFYRESLACLIELDRLDDHVMIHASPIDGRSMGILALLLLKGI